jgi:hypothetical protein
MPDIDDFDADADEIIRMAQSPANKMRKSIEEKYPQVVSGSLQWNQDAKKLETIIRCQEPGCTEKRHVFASDLFQITKCMTHARQDRARKRAERAQRITGLHLPESVSNDQLMEELGGIRPAHLLVKAKHDSSWVEYVDAEGNTKFMQIHDVRSARDKYGRWAVYGVDQNGDPVHELYDLRQGFEHSGTFSGIRELEHKEIVRLAQQGVIRGKDGKEINTLSGLMQIADEPLRKLLIKKHKEAKVGGPSLAQIEKQLFADPTASSAQKRRAGKIRV